MSSTLIVVRVSHSHNKCTPCHLTSSLLPCLLAFKNRRSTKMILQIVAPLCCQRRRCCHPKARSVCQPHGSLIFHGLLPMQSRVLIAYGRMANSIFLRGSQRKRVWILAYCQTIPPPLGGPVLKYLPSAPFFSIFGPTAVPKILVFRALALGARSPIYDKFGINNPSSKSSPLHILLHAIQVPEQRCFVSPTGTPR
jgi:hypothetical protein